MPNFQDVLTQIKNQQLQRILAFGSSNTARKFEGMHWFDCLDLAISKSHGNKHRCINAGINGNSTQQLLDRFEVDAELYKPHAVFITIGGNDASPPRNISAETYRANLLELHKRFNDMGTAVVFQTYYAPNAFEPGHVEYHTRFYQYMDIVREVAKETQSDLIDHLARWEPFRLKHPDIYIQLMYDSMHLNRHGNMVMGLDIARHFGLPLAIPQIDFWSFARQCQTLMDAIASEKAS